MKILCMYLGLLLAAVSALAAQDVIYLKTGSMYVGEVTDMNEKTISIKTATGVRTYPWKRLQVKSIKRYNPAMYAQILEKKRAEFEEKKQKLGLVKYKKKWVTPKKKKELEMRDKGFEMFEGEWTPTGKVAEVKFARKMEGKGMIKHKGKWYTEEELAEVKETEKNKGLKLGMKPQEVIAKWGKPTTRKQSQQFKTQKLEMWFYEYEDEGTEDRLRFKHGLLDSISVDQSLSDH